MASPQVKPEIFIPMAELMATASVAYTYYIPAMSREITVKAFKVQVNTAITADTANYVKFDLQDNSSKSISSLDTTTTGFTAGTTRAGSAVDTLYNVIGTSESLKIVCTKPGTGVATKGVICSIQYEVNE